MNGAVKGRGVLRGCAIGAAAALLGQAAFAAGPASAATVNPAPPEKPVKLVFVHHSCGENWLADSHGGLGRALGENNYFVSDTNYGWGPDSIGDRTDILNWPEWFAGPRSATYTAALYGCSEKNSPYARKLRDPGGENRIVMFKSCFPNSNLAGRPADDAARGDGLTVANAKAVYNEILKYFGTRPDKLFVVVTAPPVRNPAHAANARAFNTWLAGDWLKGYERGNVAVFDYYNVLTGPANHHRVRSGAIEYITDRGGDTLYYPTDGDDHPSPAGNVKATEEFVPLLNAYYNRWRSGPPSAPAPARAAKAAPARKTPEPPPPPATPTTMAASPTATGGTAGGGAATPAAPADSGVIDDFEGDAGAWEAFVDLEKNARLTFERDAAVSYSGASSMRIEYDIPPESWASFNLIYPSPRDWRDKKGLALYVRADRAGLPVGITVYQGLSPDKLSSFEITVRTDEKAVSGWQRIDVPWHKFGQPPWEGDGTASYDPARSMGMALSFHAPEEERNTGRIWVDDVSFLSAVPPANP